jgi:ABC-type transport system involved in multi-copper enzyme maturation permease subunit
MNIQPVIARELKTAARRRETWFLRLVFAVGIGLAFGFGLLLPHVSARQQGQAVLICLVVCGFILSLAAGPYLTADAVASEKRAGTLGLLFLTPLAGWEIVVGKMMTHSLQVGYALLGGFPLFFLPQLLGGVLWDEVTRILAVLILTLILSLTCGLFWSTIAIEARTAAPATIACLVLLTLVPWLGIFISVLTATPLSRATVLAIASPMTPLVFAFETPYRISRALGWRPISGASVYWTSAGFSLLLSLAFLAASGWLLPRLWRRSEAGGALAQPAVPPKAAWAQTKLHQGLLRFERAPLLWLASRRLEEPRWWKPLRGVILVFFVAMLCASATNRTPEPGFIAAFCAVYALHLATRIQLALTATERWHDDRKSGALEILLVTPVSDGDVIRAHHASVKRAFRPALMGLLGLNVALELMVLVYYERLHIHQGEGAAFSVFFIGGAALTVADFTALRWLTLTESLRSSTQLKAATRAVIRLVVGAWSAFAVAWLVAVQSNQGETIAGIFFIWLIFSLLYDWGLIKSCRDWIRTGLRDRVAEG